MEHLKTITAVDGQALKYIDERRDKINLARGRLHSMTDLFLDLFRTHHPHISIHASQSRMQESYVARCGDFQVKLLLLTHNPSANVPSVVKIPETALQVNALRNELVAFTDPENYHSNAAAFEFPMRAFRICADRVKYQTDCDEGFWTIWFCDSPNRASACLEITHFSLIEEADSV